MATSYSDTLGTPTVDKILTNLAGDTILARATVANLPSAVAGYAVSCLFQATDSGAIYVNTGTVSSATFTLMDTASTSLQLPESATDASSTTTNSLALSFSALTTGTGVKGTVATAAFTTAGKVFHAELTAAVAGNGFVGTTTGIYTGTGMLLLTASAATTGVIAGVISTSSNALVVGQAAATPVFQVDSSTSSQIAGLKLTGAATGGTVALAVIDSGSNANLTINAKGSGTIGIGSVSTGIVTITPATTISGAVIHSTTTSLVGVTTVTAAAGIVNTVAGATGGFFQTGNGNVAAVAPTAAIPLTNYYSKLDSTAGATTQTLAASTVVGLQKRIQMVADNGDDVVTVTSLTGGTIITFADVGDVAELIWTGSAWMPLALYNIADGATGPVLS